VNYKLCWISLLALAIGCGPERKTVLQVFHAGSLSVPFQRLEAAFESRYPGVDVRRQAYGSAMAIRQVTELGSAADILASADYQLIDRLMIKSPQRWANWNLLFARNAICIACGDRSPAITPDNWASVIARADVRIGIANPNNDPCGYRSLMTLYLAQSRLGKSGLFDEVILKNSNIEVERAGPGAVISVPLALSLRSKIVTRPKATDLVALLQAGAIGCLFIYRSVAVQHGLKFVELPAEIDLSSPDMEDLYAGVSVRLCADRPGESVAVRGSAILYGVTIPSCVRRRELARAFIRLLLSEEGREILRSCGQEPLWPPAYSEAGGRPAQQFSPNSKGAP